VLVSRASKLPTALSSLIAKLIAKEMRWSHPSMLDADCLLFLIGLVLPEVSELLQRWIGNCNPLLFRILFGALIYKIVQRRKNKKVLSKNSDKSIDDYQITLRDIQDLQ
jgi:hypothetical protein